MNAAIATHLNVAQQAITKIEEWKHVFFVVVRGIGARFVSKKVANMKVKVQIKGGNLPTAYIGSKSFRFSKGSQGTKVNHPELEGWRVEDCGNASFSDLSKENKAAVLNAIAQWLSNKQTIEFTISHDWKQVREANLKSMGVTKKSLEFEMYNPDGKYYG